MSAPALCRRPSLGDTPVENHIPHKSSGCKIRCADRMSMCNSSQSANLMLAHCFSVRWYSLQRRSQPAAIYLSTFDVDPGDPLGVCDVVQRIGVEDEKIGFFAGCEHSHLIELQVLGSAARGRDNHLHRCHTCVHHTLQFMLFGHAEKVVFKSRI